MSKQKYQKKSVAANKSSRHWPWLVLGFVGGTLFAGYLAHMQLLPDFFERSSRPQRATPKAKKPTEKKIPQFDFYNLLQANEQDDSPKSTPAKKPDIPAKNQPTVAPLVQKSLPAKPAPETIYFLQAAAFRNHKDADQLKAQLILAGHTVQIKKVTKGKTNWYRVLIGPVKQKADAESLQHKLASQHIKTHIITAN